MSDFDLMQVLSPIIVPAFTLGIVLLLVAKAYSIVKQKASSFKSDNLLVIILRKIKQRIKQNNFSEVKKQYIRFFAYFGVAYLAVGQIGHMVFWNNPWGYFGTNIYLAIVTAFFGLVLYQKYRKQVMNKAENVFIIPFNYNITCGAIGFLSLVQVFVAFNTLYSLGFEYEIQISVLLSISLALMFSGLRLPLKRKRSDWR